MTLWSRAFDAGRFSSGTVGTGDYSEGDLSPERSIQYLSFAVVSTDSAVKAVLDANDIPIECTTIRNPFLFDQLPRVQCYLGSLAGELAPTQLSLDSVRVYWAVRMTFEEAVKRLEFGEPSFDSLLRLIRAALMKQGGHQLTFDVGGQACPIARRSRQDGEMNYLLDFDEQSGRSTLTVELPWLYDLVTDKETGGLEQLA